MFRVRIQKTKYCYAKIVDFSSDWWSKDESAIVNWMFTCLKLCLAAAT